MWRATVLTLFPAMFPGPLGLSLAGDALARGLWSLEARDIRDHGLGRHRTVDDRPAGGGAGMVLRPDVVDAAVAAPRAKTPRRETPIGSSSTIGSLHRRLRPPRPRRSVQSVSPLAVRWFPWR